MNTVEILKPRTARQKRHDDLCNEIADLEERIDELREEIEALEKMPPLINRRRYAEYQAIFEMPQECPSCHNKHKDFWEGIYGDFDNLEAGEAYLFKCRCGLRGECFSDKGGGFWRLGVTHFIDKNQIQLAAVMA